MMGKATKKLIIVCDEKTKEYANYLRQLISVNDDKDGEIVGIEDGTVEAAVWTDKEYMANSAKVSSSEHVLFIGENKVTKSETSSMNIKFDKFGMKYGWLGKRGMLQVSNELLAQEEYDEFIQFCTSYQAEFDRVVMKTAKPKKLGKKDEEVATEETEVVEVTEDNAQDNNSDNTKKGIVAVAGAIAAGAGAAAVGVGGFLVPLAAIPGVAMYNGINKLTVHKKVKDQQYRALTVIMYIDALKEFLEG